MLSLPCLTSRQIDFQNAWIERECESCPGRRQIGGNVALPIDRVSVLEEISKGLNQLLPRLHKQRGQENVQRLIVNFQDKRAFASIRRDEIKRKSQAGRTFS